MFALIGNLNWTELLVVALAAILIFGRRLPHVAAQTAVRLGRLRRSMETLWRETGIEDEIRDVKAEVRRSVPRDMRPRQLLKSLEQQAEREVAEEREKDAKPEVEPGAPTEERGHEHGGDDTPRPEARENERREPPA